MIPCSSFSSAKIPTHTILKISTRQIFRSRRRGTKRLSAHRRKKRSDRPLHVQFSAKTKRITERFYECLPATESSTRRIRRAMTNFYILVYQYSCSSVHPASWQNSGPVSLSFLFGFRRTIAGCRSRFTRFLPYEPWVRAPFLRRRDIAPIRPLLLCIIHPQRVPIKAK